MRIVAVSGGELGWIGTRRDVRFELFKPARMEVALEVRRDRVRWSPG